MELQERGRGSKDGLGVRLAGGSRIATASDQELLGREDMLLRRQRGARVGYSPQVSSVRTARRGGVLRIATHLTIRYSGPRTLS